VNGEKTAVIVNPRSASGRTARRWPGLAEEIQRRFQPARVLMTERPGHAIEIARGLAGEGFRRILVAGGDGTVNEAANGLIASGSRETALAVLPLGTGGDFERSLGMPKRAAAAIEALAGAQELLIDAGLATFEAPGGSRQSRYFVNLASFGMGGEVAARAKNFLSPLGGKIAFLYATLGVFATYRPRNVRLWLDGAGQPLERVITNVAVGNGRYHGGGMQVCPRAELDDGWLEVTVIDSLGALELARDLPVLYSDDIYRHPKAHHYRVKQLLAEAAEPTGIEIDGEPLGRLPLEVTVISRALRVLAPKEFGMRVG